MLAGRETGGSLGKAGYESGLGESQLCGVLAEIRLRRGLDAVCIRAEVHGVEIEIEDLLLGVLALELPGKGHLVELAVEREVGAVEIEVPHQLHRDSREALGGALGADVGGEGAHEASEVHTRMAVEALVFNGYHGVAQDRRDLLATDDGPVLDPVQIGEKGAVGRVDRTCLCQRHLVLVAERGDVILKGRHGTQTHAQDRADRSPAAMSGMATSTAMRMMMRRRCVFSERLWRALRLFRPTFMRPSGAW